MHWTYETEEVLSSDCLGETLQLLFKRLVSVLLHFLQNIETSNKRPVHIELGVGGPFGIPFEALTHLLVLQRQPLIPVLVPTLVVVILGQLVLLIPSFILLYFVLVVIATVLSPDP